MSTEIHQINRETASKLNPIIGICGVEETLELAAALTSELGFLVTATELSIENLFPVFSALAAALAWERDQLAQARMSGVQEM